jgi:hypothetical protein
MAQKPITGPGWLSEIRQNFTELYAASLTVLASAAEALAGALTNKAVTPAGLEGVVTKLDILSFNGVAAAGPITLTGVKVGDKVLGVCSVTAGVLGDKSAHFETAITVIDQIQQTQAANLTANTYVALIARKS